MQRNLKKQKQKLLPVFMTLIIFAVVISVAPKLVVKESPVSFDRQQGAVKIAEKHIDLPAEKESSAPRNVNKRSALKKKKRIDVPNICQYPSLPTGCESAAAAMVLQYYGCGVTAEDFADRWLERSDNFYSEGNMNYGPDPDKVFAGNPFSRSSYGCYAAPIVNAVNNNSTNFTAEKITGYSLDELCRKYIDNDKPLLIWATMGMRESKRGSSWYFKNGERFTWIAGEHCLVLTGYNDDCYFFNDPQTGGTQAYTKKVSKKRFKELGSQAVYIEKTDKND